jgi:curved DNA-binding protein CbpA
MGTRRAATANYYEILGVERNADHDVIKRAFLDRSLRFRRELRPGGSPQAVERAEYRLHETE